MDNNTTTGQDFIENKNIFNGTTGLQPLISGFKIVSRKITDLPSWIFGPGSIMILILLTLELDAFITSGKSEFGLVRWQYIEILRFFYILAYLLSFYGIIDGIAETMSSKRKSGIAGIILSLISLGILITTAFMLGIIKIN
jgi:hypothetical protein